MTRPWGSQEKLSLKTAKLMHQQAVKGWQTAAWRARLLPRLRSGKTGECFYLHTHLAFLYLACETLGLHLDVDIGDLDIELVSIPNQPWHYIEPQFEFCCLDNYAVPFGILENIPIQFMKWNFSHVSVLHRPTIYRAKLIAPSMETRGGRWRFPGMGEAVECGSPCRGRR